MEHQTRAISGARYVDVICLDFTASLDALFVYK
jgi:hypothetical protein